LRNANVGAARDDMGMRSARVSQADVRNAETASTSSTTTSDVSKLGSPRDSGGEKAGMMNRGGSLANVMKTLNPRNKSLSSMSLGTTTLSTLSPVSSLPSVSGASKPIDGTSSAPPAPAAPAVTSISSPKPGSRKSVKARDSKKSPKDKDDAMNDLTPTEEAACDSLGITEDLVEFVSELGAPEPCDFVFCSHICVCSQVVYNMGVVS
jgi:hypothetical protein